MTKEEAIKMFLDDGAAELSVKAEQGGRVTAELRGEVHKLGWMVAKAANGIFSEIEDARIVEALDLAITKTIRKWKAPAAGFQNGFDKDRENLGTGAVL